MKSGDKYMNPYLAGVGLGLVLLASYLVAQRGLGASGAFASTVAWLASLAARLRTIDDGEVYRDWRARAEIRSARDWASRSSRQRASPARSA